MQNNELLTLPVSQITLSGFDADRVRLNYPGLMRVKPANYFGFDYRRVVRNLGLSSSEAQALFDRVMKAVQLYFPGEPGRFYCIDGEKTDKARNGPALFQKNQLSNETTSGLIEIEFAVQPLLLWRELVQVPTPAGKLRVGSVEETHALCLYKFASDTLPDGCKNLISSNSESAWLTALDVETFNIGSRPLEVAFWDGHKSFDLNVTTTKVPGWESLSLSIALAHKCKVATIFRDASDQYLTAIYYAQMISSLVRRTVKKVVDSGYKGDIHISEASVYFRVDSADLQKTYSQAYAAGLLPVKPRRTLVMDWVRQNTSHDAMYEMILKGDTSMLLDVDKKAYLKGVSHV